MAVARGKAPASLQARECLDLRKAEGAQVTGSLLFLAVGSFSLILHELGHVIGARLVGAEVKGWGIKWLGPYVHVQVDPPCLWRAQLCLISGPSVNLLLALLWLSPIPILHMIGGVNAYLGVSNLLLPKSDGWQLWRL